MTINYQQPYYQNPYGGVPYIYPQPPIYPFPPENGINPNQIYNEQSYIENILRQMPFLNLMPMGNIKLADVVSYLNAGAVAVGVGRDFYQGFTPREITQRTEEILNEVKDFTRWNKK